MKYYKDILEVVFLARGGQGAKSATEILAQAGILEGKFAKAFPEFGPERSGAPIKTYLRISGEEIRTTEPITKPDILVILDETILENNKIMENLDLDEDSIAIINSKKPPKDINLPTSNFKGKSYAIDASGLSARIIGRSSPNVAILGYLIKISELVKISSAIKVFENIFTGKIGKELTKKNILAMEEAYDSI